MPPKTRSRDDPEVRKDSSKSSRGNAGSKPSKMSKKDQLEAEREADRAELAQAAARLAQLEKELRRKELERVSNPGAVYKKVSGQEKKSRKRDDIREHIRNIQLFL